MIVGDFVQVLGEDNADWYGEVVGVLDQTLEVYFIERESNGVWKYSAEWHVIPKESVTIHVKTQDHGVVKALELLGFRPLDEGSFVKLDEEDSLTNIPVGMALPTEDDFIGIHPEMRDFIVPDEEGEAFTFAEPCAGDRRLIEHLQKNGGYCTMQWILNHNIKRLKRVIV